MLQQLLDRRPLGRLPRKTLVQKIFTLLRHPVGERRLGRHPAPHMVHDRFVLHKLRPRPLPRRHLNHGASDAPDICLVRVAFSLLAVIPQDLRGHEAGGTLEGLCDVCDLAVQVLGAPKVGHLARARHVHEYVLPLDVSVEDLVPVKVSHALEDLAGVAADDGLLELAVLGEHAGDAPPRHQLHEDVERRVLGACAEVCDDVGVLEPLHQVNLLLNLGLGRLLRLAPSPLLHGHCLRGAYRPVVLQALVHSPERSLPNHLSEREPVG
mmetsp:Transcript_12910/g.32524  ORF Transcript_12910/g.32524 Transcript_12910/m.32524 type:complete len:267 (-) Transcript_12910:129-929(-)